MSPAEEIEGRKEKHRELKTQTDRRTDRGTETERERERERENESYTYHCIIPETLYAFFFKSYVIPCKRVLIYTFTFVALFVTFSTL